MTMGPTGPRGPQGPQGAQGIQGPPGPSGPGHDDGILGPRYNRNQGWGDPLEQPRPKKKAPIDRHLVDMGPMDEPIPVLATEAERRITEFFGSSRKTRKGLDLACPFCNAAMVVRIRGRDQRAFLGCSKYPTCSGSWDVPDEAQHEAKSWERQMMTSAHTGAMLPDSKSLKESWDERDVMKRSATHVDPGAPERVGEMLDDMIDEVLDKGMPKGKTTEIRGKPSYVPDWKSKQFYRFIAVKEITVANSLRLCRGDVFHFDGEVLLHRGKKHILPQLKGGLTTGWVEARGLSTTEDIERYMRIRKEESMKEEAADVEVPTNGIKARLARSAARAPYRVARMRALTEGRKAILKALRNRVQPASFDLVEAFLDTDAGQGAVLGLVGLAGPYTPKIGKNKHVQAVCEEFLDEGVAKGANEVFGLLGMILEPVLKSVMSSLPEVNELADKVVPKRRKKRVATSEVRVARKPDPEDEVEETVEEKPRKNALRALG